MIKHVILWKLKDELGKEEKESVYEKCERSFNFGDIKEDEIEAEFTDGTLKLVIPKQEKVDTKKSIEIK